MAFKLVPTPAFITVASPVATASANPIEVCANETSQLDVIASLIPPLPEDCGLSLTGCQGTTVQLPLSQGTIDETSHAILGKENLTPGTTSCGVILGIENSNYDASGRLQWIIKQNEFPAYFLGGQLYNLTLFASSSSGSYGNVSIKIGCTNKTEFTSNTDFVTGLEEVFSPKSVNFIANGSTLLDFDQHYDWPGGMNLIIELSWCGDNAREGNLFKSATTDFASVFGHTCQNNCQVATQSGRFQFRPAFDLGICYRPLPRYFLQLDSSSRFE